jgi:hypothetical protein
MRGPPPCPPCAAIVQLTKNTPRERRVWFHLEPDDTLGQRQLLRAGCIYDPALELWSAQPPATPLRESFGCVPYPYRSHAATPPDRGGCISIYDLLPEVLR